jgi:hypothetical protein
LFLLSSFAALTYILSTQTLNADCKEAMKSLSDAGRFDASSSSSSSPSKRKMAADKLASSAGDKEIENDNNQDMLSYIDAKFDEYKKKAEELLRESKEESSNSKAFMDKLRSESTAKRTAKYSEIK